jgi:hypothetical protein
MPLSPIESLGLSFFGFIYPGQFESLKVKGILYTAESRELENVGCWSPDKQ